MKLKLTVALPNFNHGHFLPRCLEAIVEQTRRPDELIILDDGSTDDSAAIIRYYAANYSFIRPIYKEKNEGLLRAITALYQAIDTDFSYWAASDDYICTPYFFQEAMAAAELDSRVALVSGKVETVFKESNRKCVAEVSKWNHSHYATPAEVLNDYYEVEPANQSLSAATIYKHKALSEVGGFRQELGWWCDTFAIRAISLKYGMFYLDRVCTCFSYSQSSFSGAGVRNIKNSLDFVARAAWLMKSGPFRSIFPDWHVANWLNGYRDILINSDKASVYRQMDRSFLHPLDSIRAPRLLRWLVRRMVKPFYTARVHCRRQLLRQYSGDVSCYR